MNTLTNLRYHLLRYKYPGVRFNYYQDCQKVRSASQTVRDDLKRTNHGVGVQIPKEWREARKLLYPVMRTEKENGKHVRFNGAKLYVNGSEYKPSSTAEP